MNNIITLNRISKKIFSKLIEYKNIPHFIKKIYVNRNILSISEINLDIKNILDYKSIRNINIAVNILLESLFKNKKIIIVGDYDVDGVTSTALAIIALKNMGFNNIDYIIPNRFDNGYGLSKNIIEKICKINGEVILTVDNGVSSYYEIDLARKNNITVIITDHHIVKYPLPNANVIINPNINKSNHLFKNISGVGIIFYLMKALNDKLISIDWFKKKNIKIQNINDLLDLVAIGTIADISYLDLNNRILINEGIKNIKNKKCRLGILILINFLNINIDNLSSLDISFYIVPIINSAGRLKDISISLKLLLTNNKIEAFYIIKELNLLNKLRKKICKDIESDLFNLCENYIKEKNNNFIIIYNSKWHIGVLGILASKIKEKFQVPVILFSKLDDNRILGSGRSTNEFNIYNIISKIINLHSNLVLKFGGHFFAIGLVLNTNKLDLFINLFKYELKNRTFKKINKIILSDGKLLDNEITLLNAKLINNISPWGNGFTYPIFDGEFILISKKVFNKYNIKIKFKSIDKNFYIEGIIFNINNHFLNKEMLDILENKEIILAYKLCIYNYKKKSNMIILIEHIWNKN